jgi:glucan phosphorylase
MEKETKQQRFKRVAEKRVQNILNGIRSLSQCANPRIYAWDDGQIQKIWDAIENEITLCKESFSDPEARTFRL